MLVIILIYKYYQINTLYILNVYSTIYINYISIINSSIRADHQNYAYPPTFTYIIFSTERFVTWNCPYIIIQLEELVKQSMKDHSLSLLLMLELGVGRAGSREGKENGKWESRDKPGPMRIDWNPSQSHSVSSFDMNVLQEVALLSSPRLH